MSENTQSVPSTPLGNAGSAAASSYLGPELSIRGEITGDEDFRIDGKIEGPISLGNHRLTLGPAARILGNINSREIVVFGDVQGNLLAQDRVDVRRDASVVGDVKTTRVSIEDGARLKGAIEINWVGSQVSSDPNDDLALAVKKFKMKRAGGAEK